MTFVLLAVYLLLVFRGQTAMLDSHVWQEAEDDFSQWTEVFSPTTHKKLNLANNHVNLEADPTPVEFSAQTSTLADTLTEALWEPL